MCEPIPVYIKAKDEIDQSPSEHPSCLHTGRQLVNSGWNQGGPELLPGKAGVPPVQAPLEPWVPGLPCGRHHIPASCFAHSALTAQVQAVC